MPADTCARCGLPIVTGEQATTDIFDGSDERPVHRFQSDCWDRLWFVARAAEAVCASHETYGEMERDRDALRTALAGTREGEHG